MEYIHNYLYIYMYDLMMMINHLVIMYNYHVDHGFHHKNSTERPEDLPRASTLRRCASGATGKPSHWVDD